MLKKIEIKKKFLIPIISVLGLAVLIFIIVFLRKFISGGMTEDVTFMVFQETYEDTIEISGNIEAADTQKLQSIADTTIVKLLVSQGETVKKGQLLCELDTEEQQYNLARMDYEIEQKKLTGSRRDIELAYNQRKSYVKALEDRRFYARFDGVVASVSCSQGDVVEVKDEIATVLDRSYLKAKVEVAETDASRLKVGQKVIFNFPAYKAGPVEGYVSSYPAVGTITSRGATVVQTEIRIDNPPDEILTGFSFTARIEISPPQTVTLVEHQGIGLDKGISYAEVLQDDGNFKRVEVQTELYGDHHMKIISGLQPGDVLKKLHDNQRSGYFRRARPGDSARSTMSGNPPRGGR
ncbi:MAG: HlyD family efflux transporter periplasmic adaptor subunit [Spirochaetaceae bacterium]|nr:HlyD family efflux transporter periplasmic adaptor subunit [Spirochaetaceae bacterium]